MILESQPPLHEVEDERENAFAWFRRVPHETEHYFRDYGLTAQVLRNEEERVRGRPAVHRMKGTPTHNSWRSMMERCYLRTAVSYTHYGACGITVCERWWEFVNFFADMGKRPTGASLDRWPDKTGNYEPGNCRWATRVQQANNTKDNILITIDGKTQTVSEWARQENIPRSRI